MIKWLGRLAPLATWFAYLAAYVWLYEQMGSHVRLLGLVAVAVGGWFWGIVAGVLVGIAGFVSIAALMPSSIGASFALTDMVRADAIFEVLAYGGTGLAVGWLQRLYRTLKHERALSERAQIDPLTGAYTRSAFEERLAAELERAAEAQEGLAMLFVDLDRFKFVNDTYGHDTGDKLLREVGRVLRENVRGQDLVGRIGGDEFTVALRGVTQEASAAAVARGLVRELSSPFPIDGRDVQVSASIGISMYPRDGHDAESLLHSADAAMYQVKEGGKNAYHFSTIEVRTRISRRLELERQLRRAVQDSQLEVAYQPQVRLADGSLTGFEALLRWRSPELGLVSPGEFVPVAEEAGLISPIGHWMLRESALQQRAWQRQGLMPVRMAVNVSTMQFHQHEFVDTVRGALADSGIDPDLLEIEVTESVLVRDYELALRTLAKLERLGVPTALDDFGTGYSSLAYLQRLPIKKLKIDKSFVHGLAPRPLSSAVTSTMRGVRRFPEAGEGAAVATVGQAAAADPTGGNAGPIVEAICAMAHKLGKEVVAEGIETAYQRDFLRRLGVDLAQGFYYSRPLKPVQAEQLLQRVTREESNARRLRQQAANAERLAAAERAPHDHQRTPPLGHVPAGLLKHGHASGAQSRPAFAQTSPAGWSTAPVEFDDLLLRE